MQLTVPTLHYHTRIQYLNLRRFSHSPIFFKLSSDRICSSSSLGPTSFGIIFTAKNVRRNRLVTECSGPERELCGDAEDIIGNRGYGYGGGSVSDSEEEEEVVVETLRSKREEYPVNQSILNQMKEILTFSGPATGLWICGPLMSVISTAIIGQGSSTELAALGPGNVFCDNMSHLFTFLSIATSNMVVTSLAKQDKKEVQRQISILLFIGFACGLLMILFTQFLSPWALTAFSGPKIAHIVPAASKYVQIRGLAWPAILFGSVAQSASLGMKDSMGPLKALAVASVVNGIGHLVLCRLLHFGIVGAAWSIMASQVVTAYMMIEALNNKGYRAFSISIPSPNEFLHIFSVAAPVFVILFSKVGFYSLIIYFATAMGTDTIAAHQVMIQVYGMFVVWGEPLSQTAQSFMPEQLYGRNQNLEKARMLLKSLMIIGAILGMAISTIGMCIPWLFPKLFTPDLKVIQQMRGVLIMFFLSLSITPCTHSLEGTLLAGRELKFLSLSFSGSFSMGVLLLLVVSRRGYGLAGCWWTLVAFQYGRFFLALHGLLSPNGILTSEGTLEGKIKAA